MSKVLVKVLRKLHIMNETEYYKKFWKMNIGENSVLINVNIDKGHDYLITIGNECTLTNCTLLAHDASTKRTLNRTKVGRIDIGDRVFVGYDALILPNTKIGNDCIIGAKAVVTKNIPSNSVVVGNPAKIVGKTNEYIERHRELMKEKPVFNTYWSKKTKEEKTKERNLLEGIIGYDV